MNQSFSWASFSAGLVAFLATATELLKEHNSWSYFYQTPLGAIHFMVLGGAFVAMLGGALGIQLRKPISEIPPTALPAVGTSTTTVVTTEKTPHED